ncbi:MAG TPA: YciI family protein [Polyangiales bacterium]|nr:YciI family protein [Polyangiales bacterium]
MIFIVMHKINAEIAAGGPPRRELVDEMGRLIGETIASGKMLDGDGLREPATRVRLKYSGGSAEVIQGPLTGDNELVSGLLKLKVDSMEDALRWAKRYAQTIGAAEVDIGPATEAWDIGLAPKPEGHVPLRVLVMNKADKASEAGTPPAADVKQKLSALIDEMKSAGVFLAAERLGPSSKGTRLQRFGGKNRWTDGPFAESKELVSGYTIIQVDSKQEAIDWTTRYAQILGDVEVDVREVVRD